MSAADAAAEGPAVPATTARARAKVPASSYISWIALAMMTTSSVASLRAAPTMAVYGLACVFLYLLPAVVFLLPTSLVSAELASGWSGGVYKWVSEGISKPMGFLAVWCQFAMTIFYYPSLLGFVASTLAYVINPSLASSGVWTALVIVVVYWSGVWVSSRGTKGVAGLASGGLIIGTLIPGVILVTLGVVFLGQGNASAAPMDAEHLLPAWAGLSSLVLIVNNFLSYSGMEMNAVHVGSLRNPAREFPRSIFLAMGMVLLIFILPALAISWVVPAEQLSLTAGIMQAFDAVFAYFGSQWLTPIIGIMLVTASVAGMLTWLAGPSKGLLLISRQEGYLPPFLQKLNKNGVQQNILVTQGVVTTVIALGYALIPSVSSAYWIFSVITTQVYLIMYLLMFVAAVRLRRQQPDHARGYRAPLLGALCGVGFVASLAALLVGFIPPSQFGSGSPGSYLVIVAGGALGLGLLVPYLFYRLRKPSWRLPDATTQEKEASAP
ncbi:putative glutamate/gamma-aminobutyrate antiporter [Cellulosimicrobium cellulans]|jgi:putative glutamate/gamma-aminobutyrate antiporter|uniref:Amino acid:proton antiporter n=1 Tax=Cellulosimicrobium cellulans TaxID=1710 RepID=A0A1Y0HQM8_CELCE|nr:APC family permease [Cellulosimicrobium cellulans]ARU50429.1 amino acid:proton antiporter [Cellulosimicrobium cellulans]MBM7820738.1 putative glutamate/gamma-aminobutyrate antiporter [Cellulosimicrobium cellulans]